MPLVPPQKKGQKPGYFALISLTFWRFVTYSLQIVWPLGVPKHVFDALYTFRCDLDRFWKTDFFWIFWPKKSLFSHMYKLKYRLFGWITSATDAMVLKLFPKSSPLDSACFNFNRKSRKIWAKIYIFGKVLFLLLLLRFGYHDVVFSKVWYFSFILNKKSFKKLI